MIQDQLESNAYMKYNMYRIQNQRKQFSYIKWKSTLNYYFNPSKLLIIYIKKYMTFHLS